MSIEAYLFVADKSCDAPLEKLVLMHFASELSGTDGIGRIDIQKLSRFCCASEEDVRFAIIRLRECGHLAGSFGDTFSLVGFRHPRAAPKPSLRKPISATIRATVWARDGLACVFCGATDALTIDHIQPVTAGGGNDLENLQTLCMPCNIKKGVKQ